MVHWVKSGHSNQLPVELPYQDLIHIHALPYTHYMELKDTCQALHSSSATHGPSPRVRTCATPPVPPAPLEGMSHAAPLSGHACRTRACMYTAAHDASHAVLHATCTRHTRMHVCGSSTKRRLLVPHPHSCACAATAQAVTPQPPSVQVTLVPLYVRLRPGSRWGAHLSQNLHPCAAYCPCACWHPAGQCWT